jgi:predicted nucleic acid-binding protein
VTRVLADTSVWVRHFRRADPNLQSLVSTDRILSHPLVVLEVACGTPPAPRERTLLDMMSLRQAVVATNDEVLALVERERLFDTGCGAVDVALLAPTLLTPLALLWSADRNLHALALRLGVAFNPAHH